MHWSAATECTVNPLQAIHEGIGENKVAQSTGLHKSCRPGNLSVKPSAAQPLLTEHGSTLRCSGCQEHLAAVKSSKHTGAL
jgi:hypothetical protein